MNTRSVDVRADRLRAALEYAARGWHVIPLRPTGTARDRKRPAFPRCAQDTCRGRDPWCARAGRHVGWEERATTDPDRITRAWSLAPFGVGIVCGPSGLLVLDLDVPKPSLGGPTGAARPWPEPWRLPGVVDGADMLCVLAERAGQPVPLDTRTITTPSGGVQLYFTAPDPTGPAGVRLGCTAKQLAPLIDTRGWGGQVAAPPTTRDDGAPYLLSLDVPPAPLPTWLQAPLTPVHALTSPAATDRQGKTMTDGLPAAHPRPTGRVNRVDRVTAYIERAVAGERARVAAVHGPDTGNGLARNHTLFTAAVALGQLVGAGHLPADRASAELLDAARPHLHLCPDCARDAPRTIASGLARGIRQPRHLHPRGDAA